MSERPPLGIMPREFWEEHRFAELKAAIARMMDANRAIPYAWIDEYNEMTLKSHLTQESATC